VILGEGQRALSPPTRGVCGTLWVPPAGLRMPDRRCVLEFGTNSPESASLATNNYKGGSRIWYWGVSRTPKAQESIWGRAWKECPCSLLHWVRGLGSAPSPENCQFFGPWNAYFGAFCSPFEYLLLLCNTFGFRPPVYAFTQPDIPGWLKLSQRRWKALYIIFLGGEYVYARSLVIANVKTPSHEETNCHSFFRWTWIWERSWLFGPWPRLNSPV